MTTGFNILIGGEAFDPASAISGINLKPDVVIQRGEKLQNGSVSSTAFVEWSDWRVGEYDLDMVAEALDFLAAHREDFSLICGSTGIEYRMINFVDHVPGQHGGMFELDRDQIGLLHDLGFEVSIQVSERNDKVEQVGAPNP